MSGGEASARGEQQLLAAPRLGALVTAVVVVLTAVVFATFAEHAMFVRIQRLDDAWLRLMISGRSAPLTATSKLFNLLGLVYVTVPVRIAVAGVLALRRRWWHLAAFAAAVVVSEVFIGLLKGIYDRARPPGSLVATSGASFPSGHAVAASVTVVAAVITLVPAGRRRIWWSSAAVLFSILMALSRAYLGAHWLSDASAGVLLGTSCALVAALVADQFQRRWQGRRPGLPAEPRARSLSLRGTTRKDRWDRHEYRAGPSRTASAPGWRRPRRPRHDPAGRRASALHLFDLGLACAAGTRCH